MLDWLGNLGDFIGGVGVVGGSLFVGVQLRSAQKQMQANALQARMDTRINLWMKSVEEGAYPSAREKLQEHGLHTVESKFQDLPYLSWKEKQASALHFTAEMLYFQYLFYLRKKGLIEADQSGPLDIMQALASGPCRAEWKLVRPTGNFPEDFCQHVDGIAERWAAGDPTLREALRPRSIDDGDL